MTDKHDILELTEADRANAVTERIHAEAALEQEAGELARIEAAIASIEERWPKMVERARTMPECAMRSVWTMPIEQLVQQAEHVLRLTGADPGAIATPEDAAEGEHDLPEHVQLAFRRGVHLLGGLHAAAALKVGRHLAAKRAHAEREEPKGAAGPKGKRP